MGQIEACHSQVLVQALEQQSMRVIKNGGAVPSLAKQCVSLPHSGVPDVTWNVLELCRVRLGVAVCFRVRGTEEHLH